MVVRHLALILSLLCKEEIRLRFGKLQINLRFLSPCTNFAENARVRVVFKVIVRLNRHIVKHY
jgi:hypothetical protein